MRELITEQLKKDLSKLKVLKDKVTGRFAKQTKDNVAKVIPPKDEKEENKIPEGTREEEIGKEQLQAGYIIKYAKELDYEVIDEEGNRIHCKTIAEAEILSRLIELRLFFMEQK